MRALVPGALLALAAAFAACGGSSVERVDVTIGGLVIHAEVARTEEERAAGLSGRDSLPADAGMLFDLGEVRVPGYWMGGMRFPLDFIWISDDRRVVDLTENVPPPTVTGDPIANIQPDQPVRYVLEVNGGTANQYGVTEGAPVAFELDGAGAEAP